MNNQKFSSSNKEYELVNFCEFDKYATKSYCAIHGVDESLNLGDITQVDETKLKPFNFICGGSPCFPAGTKILTDHGEVNIEDIKVGEMVLTHKSRFRKVVNFGSTGVKKIFSLTAGDMSVRCTDNHSFYVCRFGKFEGHPMWMQYSDIRLFDLICIYKKEISNDGMAFKQVTGLNYCWTEEEVFDLTVEEDHSFIADGFVAHNCQDFSVAGRQAGSTWVCSDCGHEYNPLTVHFDYRDRCPNCDSKNIDKTRSSLLVEWLRIIRANKPDWGIYENVKNIVGKKFKDTFQMFIDELHEYGYNTYYKVLN